jgi:protein gp37
MGAWLSEAWGLTMGENSNIEWTDHTFNPWVGCQKVSPGCDHCYAEAMMDHRYHKVEWGPHGERKRTSEENWRKPRRWAKALRAKGERRHRVFCASLADVFDNQVPKEWRADLWQLIYETPELDWLLLTKRPENIKKMLPESWEHRLDNGSAWGNVWLGTTCEDQEHYDRRWPILRAVPAAVHFISYEPAIGPLQMFGEPPYPDWFICGGESVQGGQPARAMDPNWARQVQHGCKHHDLAFFMKQMTAGAPIPDDLLIRQFPNPLRVPQHH